MIRTQDLEQEVRRCTQAIRNVFAVDGDLDEASVETLHELLVGCVDAVNERLRRCDALLRAGLRQEAIQECESPPNVLDLLNELDMPEWNAWADYVRQFGFPPQPALLQEVAAELNDAYNQSQKLEGLLRKQRLLALARSPLSSRLALLRTIADRDPGNRVWSEDVLSYEAARLREIENEATRYSAAKNLRGLSLLQSELQTVTWRIRLPSKLVERVSESYQKLVVEEAREKLAALSLAVDAAYSEGSAERLTELRERWDRVASRADLAAGHPLLDGVRPAFDWLASMESDQARQDAYLRTLADLEAALDDETAKPAELVRLMGVVERFDEPVPATLVSRYDRRLEIAHTADRRRATLILVTAVASLTLIGAGVAFIGYRQIRSQEIAQFRRGLEADLEAQAFDRALTRFAEESKSRAYLAEDDGVQHVVSQLKEGAEAERDRAEQFDSLLAAAAEAAGVGTWDAVERAEDELDQAKAIAADADRLRLSEASRIVHRARDRLQTFADEAFASSLTPFLETLARVDRLTSAEVDEAVATVQALRRMPHVSGAALGAAKLDVALKQLENRKATLRERLLLESNVDRIVHSIGSADDYQKAIEAYRKLDGTSERSADFARALEFDLPSIAHAVNWNAAAEGWNQVKLTAVSDPVDALSKLAALKPFAGYDGVSDALAAEKYLETTEARLAARERLQDVLASPWMNLECLRMADGTYRYCDRPERAAREQDPTLSFPIYVSAVPALRFERQAVRRDEVIGGDLTPAPSPQTTFAAAVESELNKGYPFELEVCLTLHKLVTDREIDPILKLQLLDELTEPLVAASPFLEQGLDEFVRQKNRMVSDVESLTRRDLASLDWLNTKSDSEEAKARLEIVKALQVLRAKSPADSYRSSVEVAYRRTVVEKEPLQTFLWTGLLMKETDGTWIVLAPRSEVIEGAIFAFDSDSAEGGHPVSLGSVSGGKFLDASDPGAFYEGRPVYLAK